MALTRTFGRMVGSMRQGVSLLGVMAALWGAMLAVIWVAEAHPTGPAAVAAGANLEGKEVRFGIPSSALFADSTTATSTGAVNSLHDSFSAFGGGGTLLNMLFGEMTPGGVGTGLYSILIVAIIAVFLAGLMVGRTPEYLGKKLGRREVTCAVVVTLTMPALVLLGTGLAIALPATADAQTNSGAHGLSEVFYAFASAANNNGSAFGGLTVTSPFFQTALGVAMLLGRFLPILAVLALAGLLARQPRARARSRDALDRDAPVRRARGRHRRARRRDHVPPRPRSEPPRGRTGMTAPTVSTPRPPAQAEDVHAHRTGRAVGAGAFRPRQLLESLPTALRKLDPRHQVRNPVMFVVWVGSVVVTVAAIVDPSVFAWLVAVWLWFTVVFANLAEAVAEGRGRAQADALRRTRTDTVAVVCGEDAARRYRGGPGHRPASR